MIDKVKYHPKKRVLPVQLDNVQAILIVNQSSCNFDQIKKHRISTNIGD